MNKFILTILVSFCSFSPILYGQKAIGTWTSYPSLNRTIDLADAGDRVYVAGLTALFSYHKSENSIQPYTKVEGLSDALISKISYSSDNKVLVVTYQNSNIDLIFNNTDIYNIPDVKNKITSTSKAINNISFYGSIAYLSSDLGIIEINLDKKEIRNNYIIGNNGVNVRVFDTHVLPPLIYAATQEGLKYANFANSNLSDFNNWTVVNNSEGLPTAATTFIQSLNQIPYCIVRDTIFYKPTSLWQKLHVDSIWNTKSMIRANQKLFVSQVHDTIISGNYSIIENRILEIDENSSIQFPVLNNTKLIKQSFQDIENKIWVADSIAGFHVYNTNSSGATFIIPEGPQNITPFRLDVSGNDVYIANVPFNNNGSVNFNGEGISTFINGNWKSYTKDNTPAFNWFPGLIHANSVRHNASMNKTFIGSFGGLGIINHNDNSYQFFNHTNSGLLLSLDDPGFGNAKISSLIFDNSNNLWINNMQTNRQIAILTPAGEWYNMFVPKYVGSFQNMTFADNGQMWAATTEGVVVFDYGENFEDYSDDKWKLLTTTNGNGGLPNARCQSIVNDKNGDIWVGTGEGIATFYCAGNALTTNGCDADLIKVEQDGFIEYLFKTERVRSLTIDGANRKWVGTENGVWLISDDGKKEILKFNISNSPLPSNTINDIKIAENGEVYIATSLGLVSYMGDAIFGGEKPEDVFVYPNPVKPDYNGPIAIRGLVDDAYVKITNAAGVLAYQGKANGGQMIWDGKGYNGDRAASGVYLVYSSTQEGKERFVAKITLIN